jgi:hypothetical protein
MLRRRRQLLTKVSKLVDAGLFGLAFWLTHALRSLEFFDRADLIQDFDSYAWLLFVVVPLSTPILEAQGFYLRSILSSRRQTFSILARTAAWVSKSPLLERYGTSSAPASPRIVTTISTSMSV